ncbi:MAG: hypothetical protein AB1472_00495 [Candidatus Omnitrophota bacterium]
MEKKKENKKAQVTLEYAVVIFCVAVALFSMQVYIKRAIQGKIRENAENISERQYAPGKTTLVIENSLKSTTVTHSYVKEEIPGGAFGFPGWPDPTKKKEITVVESKIDKDTPEISSKKGWYETDELEEDLFE